MTAQETGNKAPFIYTIAELAGPYRRFFDTEPIPGFESIRMRIMSLRNRRNVDQLIDIIVRNCPAKPGKLTFAASALIHGNGIEEENDVYARLLHDTFSLDRSPLNARHLFDNANERDILALQALLSKDRESHQYGDGSFLTPHRKANIIDDLKRRSILQTKLSLRVPSAPLLER